MASKITLRSSDGKLFEVDETVAMKLEIIKHMIELGIIKHTIEGDCADSGIPIVKVNSKILSKVLEYCQKHVEAGADAYELMSWDDEFVKVDQATLCRLMEAANYLNIKGLLRLTVRAVGDMIRGKPFNIHNDLIKNDWGWGSGWVLLFLTQLRGWVLQFLTQPRLLRLRLRRQLRCRLRRRPRPRPRPRRV